jgi:LacI family transcriptional regulator
MPPPRDLCSVANDVEVMMPGKQQLADSEQPNQGEGIAGSGRRPTMLDVARVAGVSQTTVSHVLNESRFVSEEVRAQVLAAVETLRYRPNSLARALRRRRTGTIGLLVPNVNSPLAAAILNELDALAADHGIGVVVAQSNYSVAQERERLDILVAQQLDVLLVWPVSPDNEELAAVHEQGQQLIQLVGPQGSVRLPTLAADFHRAGYLALHHLVGHGYRRIAVLVGRRMLSGLALRGVREAALELSETCDVLINQSGDTLDDGKAQAETVMRSTNRPEAILTLSSEQLEGVLQYGRKLGLRMPNDFGLVAVYDQPWVQYLSPPLTTIRQDAHGIATAAMTLVRDLLAENQIDPVEQVFVPHLVTGGSCGCQMP